MLACIAPHQGSAWRPPCPAAVWLGEKRLFAVPTVAFLLLPPSLPAGAYVSTQPPPYQPAYQVRACGPALPVCDGDMSCILMHPQRPGRLLIISAAGSPPHAPQAPYYPAQQAPAAGYGAPPPGADPPPAGYPPAAGTPAPAGYPPTS